MEILDLLAACLEQERTTIALTLTDGVERAHLERLQQCGALRLTRAPVVICPSCASKTVRIIAVGAGSCEDCGLVHLGPQDMQRLMPDGDWLRRRIAQALGLAAAPHWPIVPGQVWRLGDVGRAGARRRVLYAERLLRPETQRALHAVWPTLVGERPAILLTTTAPDRVFLPGLPMSILPFAAAFRLRGTGLVADDAVWGGLLDAAPPSAEAVRHGPFAHDFSDVLLPGESEPIALTPAQAALLRVLWELSGERIERQALLRRAMVDLDKPVVAFPRSKYPQAHRAYHQLVRSNRRGQYWLPRD
jgi:ribosomal protein L37AE/L43A